MTRREVLQDGGVSIEVLIDGSGPLVVMIASLGRPADDFDDLAARVADAGFTAARPQPRGVGTSSGPMEGVSLADLAGDVAVAIAGLGGGPAVVVGHAFGQRVARMLATTKPELVRAVVTLAAGGKVPIPEKARAALAGCFDASLSAEQHLANVRYGFFADGNDATVWREGWHSEVARMQRAATLGLGTAGASGSHEQGWWAGGRAPMLVIQGLQDTIAVPENGRQLKAAFSDRVELIEIDGAGHALLPEKPETIASAVLAFLRQVHQAR
jgi:pimeloyl-ACP methyl ester carboxylesterase